MKSLCYQIRVRMMKLWLQIHCCVKGHAQLRCRGGLIPERANIEIGRRSLACRKNVNQVTLVNSGIDAP